MNFANHFLKKLPWFWYALALVIVAADLLTKYWASASLELYERVNIFPMFDITLRHNYGAAFSFLANQGGWQVWFFTVLSALVSIVLMVWIARVARTRFYETLGLSLVLGGALGNLYDRATLGYVVDFILVYYNEDYQFPAFNIADSAITVGAGILIVDAFLLSRPAPGANTSDTAKSE